jgi:hypothetical protein
MFREQLMSGLNQAVEYHNGGLDDNQSVIKAAADMDFNKDQAQRLIETYNTAKTIYFFKTADDRRSDFGLAEPEVVLPTLFTAPKQAPVKAASAVAGLHDYSCYDLPEQRFYRDTSVDAQGLIPFEIQKTAMPNDQTMRSLTERANKQIRVARQSATHCRDTAGLCNAKYATNIQKIAQALPRGDFEQTKLAQAEHAFWEAFGKDHVDPVMGDLLACMPGFYQEKRAAAHLEGQLTDFGRHYPQVMGWMKEALQARAGHAENVAVADQFDKMAEEWHGEFMGEARLLRDPDPLDNFLPGGLAKRAAANPTQPQTYSFSDLAGGGGGGKSQTTTLDRVGESVSRGVAGGLSEPITDAAKALTGGGAAAQNRQKQTVDRIKNLQRQLILEELSSTDPVLSGEDPDKIINAYQALWNVAPEVSLNKEVVRSVLRASTQAVSVSPFDAKAWADLENSIRDQLDQGQNKRNKKRA